MLHRRTRHRLLLSGQWAWRCSMTTQAQAHPQTSREKTPWLVLSSSVSRCLYKLTKDEDFQVIKIHRHCPLSLTEVAASRGSWLIGSSRGFLFYMPRPGFSHPPSLTYPADPVIAQAAQVVAVNPLTGAHFRLPPPSTTRFPWEMKAVLSPSLDTAVLLHRHRCDPTHTQAEFIRLPLSPSSSWKPLRLPRFASRRVDDCIFHKGCLHIIDYSGSIIIFDKHFFNNPLSAPPPSFLDARYLLPDLPSALRNHLFESPDGEDLFVLWRMARYCYTIRDGTNSFKVFKLDKNSRGLQEVESLTDLAVFVGNHGATSFSASDSCCILKPDSVYFTDDVRFLQDHALADTGVFYLGDETITLLRVANDDTILTYPPPAWLDPAVC